MKHLMATQIVGGTLAACSAPTGPSTVSTQGDRGGGSRAQGTYRQTTCSVTGFFATPPPGLGWCDLAMGHEGRVGLSLTQTRNVSSGTVFFIDGGRAVTGTAEGTTLSFSESWGAMVRYPVRLCRGILR